MKIILKPMLNLIFKLLVHSSQFIEIASALPRNDNLKFKIQNLKLGFCCIFLSVIILANVSAEILVPMDNKQWDHLRAYGLAYYSIKQGNNIYWLLNYRGGSFLLPEKKSLSERAQILGVYYEVISASQKEKIFSLIANNNMEKVLLEKAPEIAVYSPPYAEPWDDAVTLALNYAGIPYKTVYDTDVLEGKLKNFNWLHLHHEDFSGQFGKFYASFHYAPWYQRQVEETKKLAAQLGYEKTSQLKLDVAKKIKQFLTGGGLLFAMCSAPDSLDVALAANGLDIIPQEIDGDGIDTNVQNKLNFNLTLAYENFIIDTNAYSNEISNIDIQYEQQPETQGNLFFQLFEFSAKIDYIPSMLTQDHIKVIPDFLGLTSYFNRDTIKKSIIILGEVNGTNKVKYIYSPYGNGAFSFLAGHDPEDFAHLVGEAPTNLTYHKNSPGYRLILNNILFPAAKRKNKKT